MRELSFLLVKESELKVDSEFLTILRIFLHVKKNH